MKHLLPLMFFAVSLANAQISGGQINSVPFKSFGPVEGEFHGDGVADQCRPHHGLIHIATYPVRHPAKSVKKTVHVVTYPVAHPVKTVKRAWRIVW